MWDHTYEPHIHTHVFYTERTTYSCMRRYMRHELQDTNSKTRTPRHELHIHTHVFYTHFNVLVYPTHISKKKLKNEICVRYTRPLKKSLMCSIGWRKPIGCLNCRSVLAWEPLIIGLFCGKWPIKIRYPMGLRHPVHTFQWSHVFYAHFNENIHTFPCSHENFDSSKHWSLLQKSPTKERIFGKRALWS